MKAAKGTVFKYGDNVDTDVIIPARYLNSSDPAELAAHCMEDIDKTFIGRVQKGDIMVATKNFGCGSSRESLHLSLRQTFQTKAKSSHILHQNTTKTVFMPHSEILLL